MQPLSTSLREEIHPGSSLGEQAVHGLSGVILLVHYYAFPLSLGSLYTNHARSWSRRLLYSTKECNSSSSEWCPHAHVIPNHVFVTTCLLWNCSHPATALKKEQLYATRVHLSGIRFPFSCINQQSFIYSYTNIKPFFAKALKTRQNFCFSFFPFSWEVSSVLAERTEKCNPNLVCLQRGVSCSVSVQLRPQLMQSCLLCCTPPKIPQI